MSSEADIQHDEHPLSYETFLCKVEATIPLEDKPIRSYFEFSTRTTLDEFLAALVECVRVNDVSYFTFTFIDPENHDIIVCTKKQYLAFLRLMSTVMYTANYVRVKLT
jgi:hypothetical protein